MSQLFIRKLKTQKGEFQIVAKPEESDENTVGAVLANFGYIEIHKILKKAGDMKLVLGLKEKEELELAFVFELLKIEKEK